MRKDISLEKHQVSKLGTKVVNYFKRKSFHIFVQIKSKREMFCWKGNKRLVELK